MFEKVELLNNEFISKIKIKEYSWEDLINSKNILYDGLCDLILNNENIFYYATQKTSSKTVMKTREYVKKLIENNTIDVAMNDIFNSLGWNENIDIENKVFQGDIAEYLMSIFIDKFTNINTLISKISLKTSSKMPIYGNDNVYYDYEKEILYFGESKFYSDFIEGLKAAIKSIEKHNNISEISFVRNSTNLFIAENNERREKLEEIFESAYVDEINIKTIIFIANDDIYEKEKYEEKILEFYGSIEEILSKTEEIVFVFLPVLSKKEFLEYFKRRVINE